jgi:lipopolysaccharide transport system ATP-binding protein
LLQLLCGVLQPTTGEVSVNGRISALLELGAGFNRDFTGKENVYMSGALTGFSKEGMDQKFKTIAEFADIGHFMDQPVKTYSSGMYVRLAFAVSINIDPDILVIDEALAVGDIFFRQKCYEKLREFRERGVPIILVSHAMTEVAQVCQRALILEKGNIYFEGSASEAVKRYYLIEQQERVGPAVQQDTVLPHMLDSHDTKFDFLPENFFWPNDEAFIDISSVSQVSNGWARCTGVALCNTKGEPARSFEQGEHARFYYEFEMLRDLEVPIGGLVIKNETNVIVHGKSTLEYGSEVPSHVTKGSRVRFSHDVALEVSVGDYTFDVGLATIGNADYKTIASLSNPELRTKTLRLCHLTDVGNFTVICRTKGEPIQLLHHGLCNLPGSCKTAVVQSAGSSVHEVKKAAMKPFSELPTVFYITHWKAGSQWILKILRECTPERIVEPKIFIGHFLSSPIEEGRVYPTLYVTKQQFDSVRLPSNWKRFVIIRDLRDTLISAYFSFKISHPILTSVNKTLHDTLNSLGTEEGMLYLMDEWLPNCARIQTSWLEAGERLIRYEDLLKNDVEILEPIMIDDCQLAVSREHFREVVAANRFENVTKGRRPGDEDVTAHERKGISGDWKNHFAEKVKKAFKASYGGILIATGYESDMNW